MAFAARPDPGSAPAALPTGVGMGEEHGAFPSQLRLATPLEQIRDRAGQRRPQATLKGSQERIRLGEKRVELNRVQYYFGHKDLESFTKT